MRLLGKVLTLWIGLIGLVMATELKLNDLEILKGEQTLTFQDLESELAVVDVVIVGEYHNQLSSHLLQKKVLSSLSSNRASNRDLAVGVEWFSIAVQDEIENYLMGKTTTFEFLQASNYVKNWGYDFRLLQPVIKYVKQKNIPFMGLNAPKKITRKISRNGLDSLLSSERAIFPNPLYLKSEKYESFLRYFFESRKMELSEERIERMLIIQSVWDQTMAQTAYTFLQEFQNYQLLIFTGMVHAGKGQGIEDALRQMMPDKNIVTLGSGKFADFEEERFDYYALLPKIKLPEVPSLGVKVDVDVEREGVVIKEVIKDSIADEIGLKRGDILFKLGNYNLTSLDDLRIALWLVSDSRPQVLHWYHEIEVLEFTLSKRAEIVFKNELLKDSL